MAPRSSDEYGLSKGISLAAALAEAGLYVFTTGDAVRLRPAEVGAASVPYLLKVLADAGWIVRLRRGLYAGTGRLPGMVDVPPFAIATSLVTPSAIAHLSALAHHGLTEQVPRVVSAITPRKVVVPTMRQPGRAVDRHVWRTAGLDVRYVVVVPRHFAFGIEAAWLDERFRVPITDRERTVLDLFALPRLVGGLAEGLSILGGALDEIDLDRLTDHALRYGSNAVVKRLGWSLEHVGARSSALERLRALPAAYFTPLDPGRARRGKRDRRWMVIDNRTEERV
jgi:predicted transcriptional regulator of viral defense system